MYQLMAISLPIIFRSIISFVNYFFLFMLIFFLLFILIFMINKWNVYYLYFKEYLYNCSCFEKQLIRLIEMFTSALFLFYLRRLNHLWLLEPAVFFLSRAGRLEFRHCSIVTVPSADFWYGKPFSLGMV